MTDWASFPTREIDPATPLHRIHQTQLHPAWFNSDGSWRFDPPPSHRARFGVCYLGLDPLASYVEVFGRIRLVPQAEIDRRRHSELHVTRPIAVADLTDRSVLGAFGVTAAHSTGTDYTPAQDLSAHLFDAGLDGILYRVRHDPAMSLEAIALFGEPGGSPSRFEPAKPQPIADELIERGREFSIEVTPATRLP